MIAIRLPILAGVLLAALPAGAQSIVEWGDFDEQQRCVWSCLANSPGADSREYQACVADLCEDLAGTYEVPPGQPVPPDGTPPKSVLEKRARAAAGQGSMAASGRTPVPPPPRPAEMLPRPVAPAGGTVAPMPPPAAGGPVVPNFAAAPDVGAAGWVSGATADGAGRFAGIIDAVTGARVDWLCGKGVSPLFAVSPWSAAAGQAVTLIVAGMPKDFPVRTEAGHAYAEAGLGSALFRHLVGGQQFQVAGPDGVVIGTFTMAGATTAIGQAEGWCQFMNTQP